MSVTCWRRSSTLAEPTAATQALLNRISGWRDQSLGCYLIDQYAMPLMPKFVYFADYDTMPGKVSVPDLIRRRDLGAAQPGRAGAAQPAGHGPGDARRTSARPTSTSG